MTHSPKLTRVLEAIDAANAADPTLEASDTGEQPAALLYGQRMSAVLAGFAPDASEALQIAVRGQHIERWRRPRGDYPADRTGYLQWRKDAGLYHAERIVAIMEHQGYEEAERARVAKLVRKDGIKQDPEVQILEDVAALVFMRWYFAGFAANRPHDELFRIVAKTARKMSATGRTEALKLPLPPELVPAVTGVQLNDG